FVDTITVWSKDFTLAEANYKIPIDLSTSGKLGYNSKTDTIRPAPKDAITVKEPKLDEKAMLGGVSAESAPPTIKTANKEGKEPSNDDLRGMPAAPQGCFPPPEEKNQCGMPKHDAGASAGPFTVDENVIDRLGPGLPRSIATRGYFEQRMK